MKLKKLGVILIILVGIIALVILVSELTIYHKSKNYLYDDASTIPENKVGLVLGASKYNANGSINYYFKYRMDAALDLYKAGKIKYIIVSGDNSRSSYNEPQQMKEDLIAGGVPEEFIYLDYAGFRTLDSIVRINKIFGQNSFTIISQKFHNERAVFIAQGYDLETVAYNAKDVNKHSGFKTQVRERLARVKVFVDRLTNKQPKFLGEEIRID